MTDDTFKHVADVADDIVERLDAKAARGFRALCTVLVTAVETAVEANVDPTMAVNALLNGIAFVLSCTHPEDAPGLEREVTYGLGKAIQYAQRMRNEADGKLQ